MENKIEESVHPSDSINPSITDNHGSTSHTKVDRPLLKPSRISSPAKSASSDEHTAISVSNYNIGAYGTSITRVYCGNKNSVMRKFDYDSAHMSKCGYNVISQNWIPGTYGPLAFIIATVLFIFIIGIIMFIYMIIVKPDGALSVTYNYTGNKNLVVRPYNGKYKVAVNNFKYDASSMAKCGYHPVSHEWIPGRYGTFYFVIGIFSLLTGIGIIILIYLVSVKPPGILYVTYKNLEDDVSEKDISVDEKTCPKCAETIKKAAVICRFCRHEF